MSMVTDLRAAGLDVSTRSQWGSPQQKAGAYAARRKTHPMATPKARYGFLHLSVTPDTDTLLEGAAGARQIETYGYSSPPMVSYHWLVTNEARVFQGQNMGVKGTHTINDKDVAGFPHDLNAYGHAVALMQNVGDDVTDAQVRAVALTFAAMKLNGWMERDAPILPHRLFAAKACPGDKAMARLDDIRRATAGFVKTGLPDLREPTRITAARGHLTDALKLLDAAAAHRGKGVDLMRQNVREALDAGPNR